MGFLPGQLVFGAVTGTFLVEVIIRGDVLGKINDLASFQFTDAVQGDFLTVVIGTLIVPGQANFIDKFASPGGVAAGDFIFWEDGFVGTFWDAGAAIDAGVWIDVEPRPLIDWLATDDAFNGAYLNTARIAQA